MGKKSRNKKQVDNQQMLRKELLLHASEWIRTLPGNECFSVEYFWHLVDLYCERYEVKIKRFVGR